MPADVIATAMVLQALEGLTDCDTIAASRTNLSSRLLASRLHGDTFSAPTPRLTMGNTCRRGDLNLPKYVYLLVLWTMRSCWSVAGFAGTCAYVRVSDTRSFQVFCGQTADKLLTSDATLR